MPTSGRNNNNSNSNTNNNSDKENEKALSSIQKKKLEVEGDVLNQLAYLTKKETADRRVKSSHSSFLYSGSQFKGEQRSGRSCHGVEVEIKVLS